MIDCVCFYYLLELICCVGVFVGGDVEFVFVVDFGEGGKVFGWLYWFFQECWLCIVVCCCKCDCLFGCEWVVYVDYQWNGWFDCFLCGEYGRCCGFVQFDCVIVVCECFFVFGGNVVG